MEFDELWEDLLTSHEVVLQSVLGTLTITDLTNWHAQRK